METTIFDDVEIEGTLTPEKLALLDAFSSMFGPVVVEEPPVPTPPTWRPLNWHVTIRGNVVLLSHGLADEDGPVWAGEVELWRGAPAFDDHPELEHAVRAIMNPIHRDEFVRHKWTYDIPDHWAGASNFGPNHRRYLLLTASGGLINWKLTLKLPTGTPQFVWKALAYGFKAVPKETP